MAKLPIALQLYTVRDDVATDYLGPLKKVAEIGYVGVEFGGTGDLSPAEFKQVLDDLGLKPAGTHVGLDQLESNLAKAIDDQRTIGNPFIVCPWLPEDRRQDADGWKKTGELSSPSPKPAGPSGGLSSKTSARARPLRVRG